MPKVDVYDLNNEKVGELELSDAVFGAEVNEHLLYEACATTWRASEADGKTKNAGKWRVRARSCGGRRARAGRVSALSAVPLWRHGATTHGPQPRDYSYR